MSNAARPSGPELPNDADEALSQAKVEQIIEEYESESPTRKLAGPWAWVGGILCGAVSLYVLYWTQFTITTQVYRATFLALILALTFCYYPARKADRKLAKVPVYDIILAVLAIASLVYLTIFFREALQRVTRPTVTELVMGSILIVCVLEATRRTTGWALTLVAIGFVGYAFLGPYMPEPFDHRGINFQRLVGTNYLTLQGIFGIPLDVAATFIVLFTIYGAVLEYSGAGKFFLDWSFAALGKSKSGSGPGRTVTAAGFLLGTVSGSGVATTVTLGSLAWPMLKRAGYSRDIAGGMLSASGIGATLSPPTLGAAAFLIAEYLNISYLEVLIMASIPTILYYLSILLMIEADSRRMHTHAVAIQTEPLWDLTRKYGYHFSSLFAVAILMGIGMTPFMAVYWSILVAFALSFLRPETRLTSLRLLAAGGLLALVLTVLGYFKIIPNMQPSTACFWGLLLTTTLAALHVIRQRFWPPAAQAQIAEANPTAQNRRWLHALEYGGKSVVSIAATTACAGLIVSVVTLTGLGLKISGLIVSLGGGAVLATVFFAAIAVWVLGLAVPVTASYILAYVMIVPALLKVGVYEPAAHMFIFYYAVLADVSPPTALAPMAAAAITGGKPFRTMMMAWKYCLPAFLVPFMFCLSPEGAGLLLKGEPLSIVWTFVTGCLAVVGLAVAFGGWIIKPATIFERLVIGLGGLALLYADLRFDGVGFVLLLIGLALHLLRTRRVATEPAAEAG